MRLLPRPESQRSQSGQRRLTRDGGQRPIIVGVAGRGGGGHVVDWAAAEAASRHRSLRVVHAFTWPMKLSPDGAVLVGGGDFGTWAAAELIVQEAADRARSVAPDLEVTTQVVVGAAAPVMLRQTREAELVVLGGPGLDNDRRSLDVSVVARAACPIAVLRPFRRVAPGPSATGVVVGMNGSELSHAAIGVAFEAAARRGVGLTAVHACGPRDCANPRHSFKELTHAASPGRSLDLALTGWRVKFPGVDFVPRLVHDPPGPALVAESAGAALVVVGCRGRGRLGRRLFGSVSQTVLCMAHSPIMVVRPVGHATWLR